MPNDPEAVLAHWQLTPAHLREQMYGAPTPRERERWHALWLLSQGWSAAAVARALERDAHTIGAWLEDFRRHGPAGLAFVHTGGAPPPSTRPAKPS
jgi:transposase